MKPEFDFDKLLKNEQARRQGPGDSTRVRENIKLSLHTKLDGEKGDKHNEKI